MISTCFTPFFEVPPLETAAPSGGSDDTTCESVRAYV